MASLQSLVRTDLAVREGKLTSFAKELSNRLYEETAEERYVTLFFAVLDTSSLVLHYVNAGHNPPLFFRKWTLARQSSEAEMLDTGGPPLGLFPESEYVSGRVYLQEGDVLVLYTDGTLDATNREHDQFGEERFRETLRSSLSLSASEICHKVVDRMDAFSSGAPQWDDVTLAVVKLKSEVVDFSMVETEQRNGHGD